MRIKIVQEGWETFSDVMSGVQFINGVSVDDVTDIQAARISACVRTVNADDADEAQIGPAIDAIAAKGIRAPETVEMERQAEADAAAIERQAEADAAAAAEAAAAEIALADARAKTEAGGVQFYTRTELEAIGSNDGIRGLRDIADKLDVRNTSISGLIEGILSAQAAAIAVKDEQESA